MAHTMKRSKKKRVASRTVASNFRKGSEPISIVIILSLLIVLGSIIWVTPLETIRTAFTGIMSTKEDASSSTPTPTISPTPTPIVLHSGIGKYAVSHGATNGPTISTIIFNPLDVQKNEPLIFSVELSSDTPVTSVTGIFQTDSKKTPITFTKVTESLGMQIWSTQYIVTDTLWYTYMIKVTATNKNGSTTVTVAPRS
jgi:hypothetical protein